MSTEESNKCLLILILLMLLLILCPNFMGELPNKKTDNSSKDIYLNDYDNNQPPFTIRAGSPINNMLFH